MVLNKEVLDKATNCIDKVYNVTENTKLLTNISTFYSGYFRKEIFDYYEIIVPIFRLIVNLNMSLPLRLRLTKLYNKDKDKYYFVCVFALNSTLDDYEFLLTSNCGDPDKGDYFPTLLSAIGNLDWENNFQINDTLIMEVGQEVNKWDFNYYIKLPSNARKHLVFADVYEV